MLELRDIRAGDIDERRVGLDDAARDERSHAEMVVPHSDVFEVAPGEDQGAEILIDRLQQRLGRREMQTGRAGVLVASVAVDADVVSDVGFASAAEGLDGEHVAFFHALRGSSFDKGDLFVAVDFVAQDVVAREVPNRFDGNSLSVDLDFVALHRFLDRLTDVIDSGVDASFLRACFSLLHIAPGAPYYL